MTETCPISTDVVDDRATRFGAKKAGVLSFVLDGFRSEDVGTALNQNGIAVRSGHHCAQPALRHFGLESTVRPSLALYDTRDDIDALVSSLRRLHSGHSSNHLS